MNITRTSIESAETAIDFGKLKNKGSKALGFIQKFLDKLSNKPAIYRIEFGADNKSVYMQVLPAKNPPAGSNLDEESRVDLTDTKEYEGETKEEQEANKQKAKEQQETLDAANQFVDLTFEYFNVETQQAENIDSSYTNVQFIDRGELGGMGMLDAVEDYLKKNYSDDWREDNDYEIFELKDGNVKSNANEIAKRNREDAAQATKNRGANTEQNAAAATSIKMKLKKVMSSDSIDIQLVSVTANYSPVKVLSDIDMLLDDPEVIAMIPDDGDANFEVSSYDDSMDIDVCDNFEDEISPLNIFLAVMKPAFSLYNNMLTLRWNAKGEGLQDLLNSISTIEWTIRDIINEMGRLCTEYVGYCPNPMSICQDGCSILEFEDGCTHDQGVHALKDGFLELSAGLELYYCDMPHEIQSLYDTWILELERNKDYLTRSCME